VHVAELKQLFNAIDPSPFRERDLDPNAEQFIVEWGREVPRDVPLALVVHLDRPAGLPEEASVLRDAVREFFSVRAETTRRRLRQLFRVGRMSLLIGIAFVAATVAAGDLIAKALQGQRLGEIIKESLLIGGWVAMWRPLEVFLYDWWPIRQEAQLYDPSARCPSASSTGTPPSRTPGDRTGQWCRRRSRHSAPVSTPRSRLHASELLITASPRSLG
jgi:hypothetical protein